MLSVRAACKAFSLIRTVFHYRRDTQKEQPVIEVLVALVDRYTRYGFGNLFPLIRRQGIATRRKEKLKKQRSYGKEVNRLSQNVLTNNLENLMLNINPVSTCSVMLP